MYSAENPSNNAKKVTEDGCLLLVIMNSCECETQLLQSCLDEISNLIKELSLSCNHGEKTLIHSFTQNVTCKIRNMQLQKSNNFTDNVLNE